MCGNKSGEIRNFEIWNINRPLSMCVLIGVFLFSFKYGRELWKITRAEQEGENIIKTLHQIAKKILILTIIFVSLLSVFATEAPAAEYKYIKIPTPQWWQTAYAYDINDSGNVVGYVWYNSNPPVEPLQKGFIFKKHIYIPLLPTGWKRAAAYRINNRGAVLGLGD